jgi:hypothetical protein
LSGDFNAHFLQYLDLRARIPELGFGRMASKFTGTFWIL